MKCVESQNATKEGNKTKQRKILDDASTSGGTKSASGGPKHYITYRSCVPLVGEEKLSVLGFEVLKLQNFSLLLLQILLNFYRDFFLYSIMSLVFPNVDASGLGRAWYWSLWEMQLQPQPLSSVPSKPDAD